MATKEYGMKHTATPSYLGCTALNGVQIASNMNHQQLHIYLMYKLGKLRNNAAKSL